MTHIDTADRDAADRIAFLAEQAEVQYVRESFDWHQVEPKRQGTFEWAKIDQTVEVTLGRTASRSSPDSSTPRAGRSPPPPP